jgi:hypothetical protein
MSSLVALDRRLFPPGTAGEERNDLPGAQAVIAGDRLINGGGGQFAPDVGTLRARLRGVEWVTRPGSVKRLESVMPEESV